MANPDIPGDAWPEGELPEQYGGGGPTLLPGIDTFRLPINLAQLWDQVDITMNRPGHPDHNKPIRRVRLKFDRNNPLVVVGGAHDGETMTGTFTSNPRPRGRKDDPKTPWISDLAYLLEIGLGDRSRPTTAAALQAAINRHAGKLVRLDHGLSAHCREDKVRYVYTSPNGGPDARSELDPTEQRGCGLRYYTKDFRDPDSGNFSDQLECECGAALRGFPSVERFLPPLGGGGGGGPHVPQPQGQPPQMVRP
jgi:hypothetical protein